VKPTKTLPPLLFSTLLFLAPVVVFAAPFIDRIVAVVSDQPLLESEVQARLEEIKKSPSLASVYGLDPSTVRRDDVYRQMLEEKIIEVSIAELKLNVSDAEVESQIGKIAAQNRVDRKALDASLRREGISLETYRKNIRSQMERRNLFDRELRGAGGVSEVELRALYEKSAPVEFDVSLVNDGPKSSASVISEIRKSGRLKDFASENSGIELGWINPESLTPSIQNVLKKAEAGDILGPVSAGGKKQWVLVHGKRRGSQEGFIKERDRLAAELQGQDFERRLSAWLERRKKELQIVENQ
jgi:peptidyl-prolyl cis-trans isomerase SurA